jgi:hypothetical protein
VPTKGLPVRTVREVRKVLRHMAVTGQLGFKPAPCVMSVEPNNPTEKTRAPVAAVPKTRVANTVPLLHSASRAMYATLRAPPASLNLRPILHSERLVSVTRARGKLQEVFENMYVPKTLRHRQQTLARLTAWCKAQKVDVCPDSAALFAVAIVQMPQGTLALVKELIGTLRFMFDQASMLPLRALQTALVQQGAAIPRSQSIPVERLDLIRWVQEERSLNRSVPLLENQPPVRVMPVAMACMLAWKTISRWDDVASLSSENLLEITPSRVVLDWWTCPKGRRAKPERPSRYAIITGQGTATLCTWLTSLGTFQELSCLNSTHVNRVWAKHPIMCKYVVSGIKPGARTYVQARHAKGEMPQVSQLEICRLAKHSVESDPYQNLGMGLYSRDHIANAVSLGTSKVSYYL